MTSTTSPILHFGKHRGEAVDNLPEHYLRWLVDPARDLPQEGQPHRPMPKNIVAAAQKRLDAIKEAELQAQFASRCLGGHPTGYDTPIFIIECEGDCHSKSGPYSIDEKWFHNLDDSLGFLASEFPMEKSYWAETAEDPDMLVRSTPDPEDDMILVWEVLPTGHRKVVWGFFGWHHSSSSDTYACGQSSLPGDTESLYSLAMKDC